MEKEQLEVWGASNRPKKFKGLIINVPQTYLYWLTVSERSEASEPLLITSMLGIFCRMLRCAQHDTLVKIAISSNLTR